MLAASHQGGALPSAAPITVGGGAPCRPPSTSRRASTTSEAACVGAAGRRTACYGGRRRAAAERRSWHAPEVEFWAVDRLEVGSTIATAQARQGAGSRSSRRWPGRWSGERAARARAARSRVPAVCARVGRARYPDNWERDSVRLLEPAPRGAAEYRARSSSPSRSGGPRRSRACCSSSCRRSDPRRGAACARELALGRVVRAGEMAAGFGRRLRERLGAIRRRAPARPRARRSSRPRERPRTGFAGQHARVDNDAVEDVLLRLGEHVLDLTKPLPVVERPAHPRRASGRRLGAPRSIGAGAYKAPNTAGYPPRYPPARCLLRL